MLLIFSSLFLIVQTCSSNVIPSRPVTDAPALPTDLTFNKIGPRQEDEPGATAVFTLAPAETYLAVDPASTERGGERQLAVYLRGDDGSEGYDLALGPELRDAITQAAEEANCADNHADCATRIHQVLTDRVSFGIQARSGLLFSAVGAGGVLGEVATVASGAAIATGVGAIVIGAVLTAAWLFSSETPSVVHIPPSHVEQLAHIEPDVTTLNFENGNGDDWQFGAMSAPDRSRGAVTSTIVITTTIDTGTEGSSTSASWELPTDVNFALAETVSGVTCTHGEGEKTNEDIAECFRASLLTNLFTPSTPLFQTIWTKDIDILLPPPIEIDLIDEYEYVVNYSLSQRPPGVDPERAGRVGSLMFLTAAANTRDESNDDSQVALAWDAAAQPQMVVAEGGRTGASTGTPKRRYIFFNEDVNRDQEQVRVAISAVTSVRGIGQEIYRNPGNEISGFGWLEFDMDDQTATVVRNVPGVEAVIEYRWNVHGVLDSGLQVEQRRAATSRTTVVQSFDANGRMSGLRNRMMQYYSWREDPLRPLRQYLDTYAFDDNEGANGPIIYILDTGARLDHDEFSEVRDKYQDVNPLPSDNDIPGDLNWFNARGSRHHRHQSTRLNDYMFGNDQLEHYDENDVLRKIHARHGTTMLAQIVGRNLGLARRARVVVVARALDPCGYIEGVDRIINHWGNQSEEQKRRGAIFVFAATLDSEQWDSDEDEQMHPDRKYWTGRVYHRFSLLGAMPFVLLIAAPNDDRPLALYEAPESFRYTNDWGPAIPNLYLVSSTDEEGRYHRGAPRDADFFGFDGALAPHTPLFSFLQPDEIHDANRRERGMFYADVQGNSFTTPAVAGVMAMMATSEKWGPQIQTLVDNQRSWPKAMIQVFQERCFNRGTARRHSRDRSPDNSVWNGYYGHCGSAQPPTKRGLYSENSTFVQRQEEDFQTCQAQDPIVPPPTPHKAVCYGLMPPKRIIEANVLDEKIVEFCNEFNEVRAHDRDSGSFHRRYFEGELNDVEISIDWPQRWEPDWERCTEHMRVIAHGCDKDQPNPRTNVFNYKAGGTMKVDRATYGIYPQRVEWCHFSLMHDWKDWMARNGQDAGVRIERIRDDHGNTIASLGHTFAELDKAIIITGQMEDLHVTPIKWGHGAHNKHRRGFRFGFKNSEDWYIKDDRDRGSDPHSLSSCTQALDNILYLNGDSSRGYMSYSCQFNC